MIHHFIHHLGTLAIAYLLFLGAEQVADSHRGLGRRRHAFLIALSIGLIIVGEYLHSPNLAWSVVDGDSAVLDIHAGLIAAVTVGCGLLVGTLVTAIKLAAGLAVGGTTNTLGISALVFAAVAGLVWLDRRWTGPRSRPFRLLLVAAILVGAFASLLWDFVPNSRSMGDRAAMFATESLGTLFLGGMILFHQARRRSDSLLKDALVNALDAFFRIEPNGRIRETNHAAETLLGFPREELLRMNIADLGFTLDPRHLPLGNDPTAPQGSPPRVEMQWRRKEGTPVDLEISTRPAREPGEGWNLFARDITARKAAEAQSKADQTRLHLALDAAEMVVWELDVSSGRIRYSDNLAALSGQENLSAYQSLETFLQQVHPDDRPQAAAALLATVESGAPFECDYRVQLGNGAWRWLLGKGRIIQFESDRASKVLGVAIDITRRREAEDHARRWQQVFEKAEFGFAHVDHARNTIIEVNDSFARQRGYTPEELVGRPISDIVSPSAKESPPPPVPADIPPTHRVFPSTHLRRDGSEFPVVVELTTILDSHGNPTSRVACVVDHTENQRVQAVLEEERRRLDAVIEGSRVGIWEWDIESGACIVNERWAEMVGYRVEELAPITIETWNRLAHPEDLAASQKIAQRHFCGELPYYECEVRMRHKDGRWIWVLDRGRVSTWDDHGKPRFMMGTHTDIHQLKLTEIALRESEDKLAKLIGAAQDAIIMVDDNDRISLWNESAVRILGYTREEALGRTLHELLPASRIEASAAQGLAHFHRTGEGPLIGRIVELTAIRKDGSLIPVELSLSAIKVGKSTHAVGILRDVSERHRAESAIRASEERLRESLLFRREAEKIGRIGAWKVSPQTDYLYWTEGVYEIIDAPPDYRPGLAEGLSLYDADSLPILQKALTKALADGTSFVLEIGLTTKKGRHIWTEVRGLGRIQDGGESFVMGTFQDITERRRAAQALAESEERLRLALESSGLGLYDLDVQTGKTLINQEYAGMLGYQVDELQETNELWASRLHPDDIEPATTAFNDYLAGRISEYRIEFRQKTKSGDWKWIQSLGRAASRDASGRPLRMLGTHLDIQDRKQAEQRTRLLRDLGLTVARTAARDDALRLSLKTALAIAEVEAGGIYVVDETRGDLDLVCHEGLSESFVQAVRHYAAGAPNVRWAAAGRIFHGSVDHLPLSRDAVERQEGLKALSLIPVLENGKLVAVINIASHRSEEVPHSSRVALESVAGVVAGVIQRAQAERLLQRANAELEQRVSDRTRELSSSEQRYRSLFETSRDAVLIVDDTGRIFDGNPAALTLFGFASKDEMMLCRVPELSPEFQPDGRHSPEAFEQTHAEILATGSHFFEWTHQRRDGTEFPAEVAVSVATIDGRPLVQGLIRDISHRRAAENELRASEARFRRLLEMAPIPMGLANDHGDLLFLNARFVQTFGYSLAEVPTLEHWKLKAYPDPTYREQVWDRWMTAVSQASTRQTDIEPNEFRVTCRDGSVRDVIMGGIKLGADVLATFLDVTGLREADADLRKLRSAVEQSPTVVVITNTRGDIEYVNPAFVTQTGYQSEEVLGSNTALLKSGFHDPSFYQELWQTLKSKSIWRGDFCNRRKDGTLFWESATIAPVLDADGRLTHFVAIKEDITQRRAAAEELRRAKEAAEAANQAKSRFLANMSHEIRTPMNVILGFSQILRRDPGLPPALHRHLDTINRSGEHLLRLINDILDMSKIEAGRMRANPADFDFESLVDDLATMFRQRAEDKGLVFELDRGPSVPVRLHADPGRVRQVLLNLLGNAVKFTERGHILLQITAQRESMSTSVSLLLEVMDTGPGIPAEDLERIFEPFEQAGATTTHGGTGLGLAISRQLARILGGDITASSTPGVGSIFRFAFVAQDRDEAGLAETTAANPARAFKLKPGTKPPTILVADDSPGNRELLRAMLEDAGFVVYEATHGAEAVAFCAAAAPDLVLIDRRMPVLDGLAAITQIRQGPGGRKTRVVVVSASVLEATSEWQKAGADGFIGKPVVYTELMTRIGALLAIDFDHEGDARPAQPSHGVPPTPALPPDLRHAIIEATESGDVAHLRQLIEDQVAAIDPALAQSLRQWVSSFDYDAILKQLRTYSP